MENTLHNAAVTLANISQRSCENTCSSWIVWKERESKSKVRISFFPLVNIKHMVLDFSI